MTSKERIEKTFSGGTLDHPAVTPILMSYAARYIGKTYRDYYLDHRVLVESYLRCREAFGFDMHMVISDPFRETEAFGGRFDYPEDGIPVPREHLLKTLDRLDALAVPDPRDHRRMADRVEAVALFRKETDRAVPILGWVEGPFAEAADLRGVQELM
ncbi:MAG TPA: uroporphyrinogen decarboxylase family protein, partial [Atribacteraceae bacterium]|nr:uroporphyrinogen decarboxylase family protein [Atribacteraceae bacterium]